MPTVGKANVAPPAPIEVSIKADQSYFWNMGEEVDTDQGKQSETATELPALINTVRAIMAQNSAQGKPVQVFVRGDKRVPYEAVMKVMGGLQQAGVANVGLITEAP